MNITHQKPRLVESSLLFPSRLCLYSCAVNAPVLNPLNAASLCMVHSCLTFQKQYHSHIDELIEESVKDMISLLVAKVCFGTTVHTMGHK